MSDAPALFAALPPPLGPFAKLLEQRVTELTEGGAELDPVVLELVRYLATRVDRANAEHRDRGFVILAAEVRAAYRDLTGDGVGGDGDTFADMLAEFAAAEQRAAAAGDAAGSEPDH